MNFCKLFLFMALLSACGVEYAPTSIDSELVPLLNEFELRQINLDLKKYRTSYKLKEFTENPNKLGECYKYVKKKADGTVYKEYTVYIAPHLFTRYSVNAQLAVLVHEVLHCSYNVKHIKDNPLMDAETSYSRTYYYDNNSELLKQHIKEILKWND